MTADRIIELARQVVAITPMAYDRMEHIFCVFCERYGGDSELYHLPECPFAQLQDALAAYDNEQEGHDQT